MMLPLGRTLFLILGSLLSFSLFGHGVDATTSQLLTAHQGSSVLPFIYLGARHMITGYDHLLFLLGVVCLLFRVKELLLYVTLFTLAHSAALLVGALGTIDVNAYPLDIIIGLSIVYKGVDNLGGVRKLLGYQPDTRAALVIVGLLHGVGLASQMNEFLLPDEGGIANILAFNVGIEIGQLVALSLILLVINGWRRHTSYRDFALASNALLISAGLMLMGFGLGGDTTLS